MEQLPEQSEASTSNGIWFVWKDGTNIIRAWGSALNGKEKIYLNDTLVSEKRNLKITSEHIFEDADRNVYGVTVNVASLFRGIMECQMKKNGELKKKFICKFVFGRIFTLKNLGIFLGGFAIICMLQIILTLKMPLIFILMMVLLGFIYKMTGKQQYTIDELDA